MATHSVHIITARGEGLPYEALEAGEPVSVPASRTGIGHFRNRGQADLVLSVTAPGPFGPMDADLIVPAGADRFLALSGRLAADGLVITFTPSGDLSAADAVFFDRDVLDRA